MCELYQALARQEGQNGKTGLKVSLHRMNMHEVRTLLVMLSN